jgi:hypothetical protein
MRLFTTKLIPPYEPENTQWIQYAFVYDQAHPTLRASKQPVFGKYSMRLFTIKLTPPYYEPADNQ